MLHMITWLIVVEHTQYLSFGEMLNVETIPSTPGNIVRNTSPVDKSKIIIRLEAEMRYLVSLVIDIPTT